MHKEFVISFWIQGKYLFLQTKDNMSKWELVAWWYSEGNYQIEGHNFKKNRVRERGGGVMLYVVNELEFYECN